MKPGNKQNAKGNQDTRWRQAGTFNTLVVLCEVVAHTKIANQSHKNERHVKWDKDAARDSCFHDYGCPRMTYANDCKCDLDEGVR